MAKRVGIYLRVSTKDQATANQLRELRQVAEMGRGADLRGRWASREPRAGQAPWVRCSIEGRCSARG